VHVVHAVLLSQKPSVRLAVMHASRAPGPVMSADVAVSKATLLLNVETPESCTVPDTLAAPMTVSVLVLAVHVSADPAAMPCMTTVRPLLALPTVSVFCTLVAPLSVTAPVTPSVLETVVAARLELPVTASPPFAESTPATLAAPPSATAPVTAAVPPTVSESAE